MKNGDENIHQLVASATAGDRAALEALFQQIQRPVYQLAVRMLWHPEEARDATQEILIKILTSLARFEGRSQFRTWVYRIAANHLMTVRSSRLEKAELSWEAFGRDLSDGLAGSSSIEDSLLAEEIKVGCTHAMLLCLDRPHRLAYILGDIVGFEGPEGARMLEITPAACRKRLSRARSEVSACISNWCGLVRPENACRCDRRAERALSTGRVKAGAYQFARSEPQRDRVAVLHTIRQLNAVEGTAELYRSHGDVPMPPGIPLALDSILNEIREIG